MTRMQLAIVITMVAGVAQAGTSEKKNVNERLDWCEARITCTSSWNSNDRESRPPVCVSACQAIQEREPTGDREYFQKKPR